MVCAYTSGWGRKALLKMPLVDLIKWVKEAYNLQHEVNTPPEDNE
jgi:hypothetical protein